MVKPIRNWDIHSLEFDDNEVYRFLIFLMFSGIVREHL